MAKLEIDYSEVNVSSLSTIAQEEWEPPVHKFFGKKLANGKTEKELHYTHKEYPRMMYGKRGDKIVARVVNSDEEKAALGENWATNPAAFGLITAPSFEQRLEMEAAERAELGQPEPEPAEVDVGEVRRPGRPKKVD